MTLKKLKRLFRRLRQDIADLHQRVREALCPTPRQRWLQGYNYAYEALLNLSETPLSMEARYLCLPDDKNPFDDGVKAATDDLVRGGFIRDNRALDALRTPY